MAAFTVLLRQEIINDVDDTIDKNNILRKLFKKSVKFVGVGIAGISTWFITNIINKEDYDPRVIESIFDFDHILFPTVITVIVIGFGLVMIYCSKKYKKN